MSTTTTTTTTTTTVELEIPKEQAKTQKSESFLKSFLAGGFGGACLVMVGHPLDLIKVRMQTSAAGASQSVLGMLGQTLRAEGMAGLYRGVLAPLTAVTPLYAIQFLGYDMGKWVVRNWEYLVAKRDISTFSIPQLCIAGGISAIPATAVMAPTERIKCLLQIQESAGGTPKYNGMVDCARQVYREGGVRSLFKGTIATLMRDVPGSIVWFGVYEFAKKELMRVQGIDPQTGSLSPLAVITAGGLAGMCTWGVTMPPDVIKSRWQTAPDGTYNGLWNVYTDLVQKEGTGALFKGIRPAMIRAFPANAACFFGMEVGRKLLSFLD